VTGSTFMESCEIHKDDELFTGISSIAQCAALPGSFSANMHSLPLHSISAKPQRHPCRHDESLHRLFRDSRLWVVIPMRVCVQGRRSSTHSTISSSHRTASTSCSSVSAALRSGSLSFNPAYFVRPHYQAYKLDYGGDPGPLWWRCASA
jgi:hypothetical protein